jgi:hypothetical protein
MRTDLKKHFYLDKVSPYELGQILLNIFHRAQGTEKGYKYQDENKPEFVEFIFNKKGDKIIDILLSDKFPQDKLTEISAQIDDKLVKNQNTAIGQVVCFATAPLKGCFRYKDLFQILPVPEEAPKPTDIVTPQPFLLQAAYTSSPDGMIAASRKEEEVTKWVKLLNIFLNRNVYVLNDFHRMWVLNPDKDHVSESLQVGYNFNGFSGITSSFSICSQAVGRIPTDKYYTERGIDGNTLQVPQNIEAFLEKALSLDDKKWKKLYRASTWYAQAYDIWGKARSSSYVALVSALESLEDSPKMCAGDPSHPLSTGDVCKICGEPRFDITLHFKKFMEKYVPELKDLPEERDIIYRTRSSLSHGSALLSADDSPGAKWLMNKRGRNEDERHRQLFEIVRLAILRWLRGN